MFVATFTINMDPNILGQFTNISVPSTLAVAVGYEPNNWSLFLVVTNVEIILVVEIKLVGPDWGGRKFCVGIFRDGLKVSVIDNSICITSKAKCSVECSINQGPVDCWILGAKTE